MAGDHAGLRLGAALVVALALATACRPKPALPPAPRPADSFVTVAAEIRRHSYHDIYRRPWPRDAAGYNPFRAGLIRLANHESLFPGRHADAVAFLRGECLLYLRAYGEAGRAFAEAERLAPPGAMRDTSRARRLVAQSFERATSFPPDIRTLDAALVAMDAMLDGTAALASEQRDPGLKDLAKLENESAGVAKARFLTDYRAIMDGGPGAAADAWRDLIAKHGSSHRVMAHRMALGRLYEDLALDYLERLPPERYAFEREVFLNLAGQARAEFQTVATADGYPEKPVAQGRLAALNALVEETLRAAE